MIRENYHKADVELKDFLVRCKDCNYEESQPSQLLLIAVVMFVVASELALVFYFMGEHLGATSAAYAATIAIMIVFCAAAGTAFCHANTSRNLPEWRRLLGLLGALVFIALFFYGIGLLSGWRADSVVLGFAVAIEGYKAMSDLPIFVTAFVNLIGFALLTHEVRKFFWPKYWGYRPIFKRFEDAEQAFKAEHSIRGDHD